MIPCFLLLAASAVGFDYGWESLPDGGSMYIVQFDPAVLEEAQIVGLPLQSDIPAEIKDIRTISIRLGTEPLPKKSPPMKSEADLSQKSPPPMLLSPQSNNVKPPSSKETKPLESTSAAESPKPWWLIGISIFLCASLGGNFYLLWIFATLRKRYLAQLVR
jgi:hypothetical protein